LPAEVNQPPISLEEPGIVLGRHAFVVRQKTSRAGVGLEYRGPLLARWRLTDLELVAIQFVDPMNGLAGERSVQEGRLVCRIDRVDNLKARLAVEAEGHLIALDTQTLVSQLRSRNPGAVALM